MIRSGRKHFNNRDQTAVAVTEEQQLAKYQQELQDRVLRLPELSPSPRRQVRPSIIAPFPDDPTIPKHRGPADAPAQQTDVAVRAMQKKLIEERTRIQQLEQQIERTSAREQNRRQEAALDRKILDANERARMAAQAEADRRRMEALRVGQDQMRMAEERRQREESDRATRKAAERMRTTAIAEEERRDHIRTKVHNHMRAAEDSDYWTAQVTAHDNRSPRATFQRSQAAGAREASALTSYQETLDRRALQTQAQQLEKVRKHCALIDRATDETLASTPRLDKKSDAITKAAESKSLVDRLTDTNAERVARAHNHKQTDTEYIENVMRSERQQVLGCSPRTDRAAKQQETQPLQFDRLVDGAQQMKILRKANNLQVRAVQEQQAELRKLREVGEREEEERRRIKMDHAKSEYDKDVRSIINTIAEREGLRGPVADRLTSPRHHPGPMHVNVESVDSPFHHKK